MHREQGELKQERHRQLFLPILVRDRAVVGAQGRNISKGLFIGGGGGALTLPTPSIQPTVRNLSPARQAKNRFQDPSLELSSQATQACGPVRQPYAYLVPSPHNGARICRPFKDPRNQFPAWRAGTTSLFATQAGCIGFLESIPGLHKHVQIRALDLNYRLSLLKKINPQYMLYKKSPVHSVSQSKIILLSIKCT